MDKLKSKERLMTYMYSNMAKNAGQKADGSMNPSMHDER